MKLVLPYPVSANRYWHTFPYLEKGYSQLVKTAIACLAKRDFAEARNLMEQLLKVKARAVTVPSSEAKAYKEEVAWRARAAGFRDPTDKPIEISSITLHPRPNKDGSASAVVLDLGNCWKIVEDALQGVVYLNDKQIKRIRQFEYGAPVKDGQLVIEVIEFVPAQAPLFAEIEPPKPEPLVRKPVVPDGMPF